MKSLWPTPIFSQFMIANLATPFGTLPGNVPRHATLVPQSTVPTLTYFELAARPFRTGPVAGARLAVAGFFAGFEAALRGFRVLAPADDPCGACATRNTCPVGILTEESRLDAKLDNSRSALLPHLGHFAAFPKALIGRSISNVWPHSLHRNSYIGIRSCLV